jgi:hypothetical protein
MAIVATVAILLGVSVWCFWPAGLASGQESGQASLVDTNGNDTALVGAGSGTGGAAKTGDDPTGSSAAVSDPDASDASDTDANANSGSGSGANSNSGSSANSGSSTNSNSNSNSGSPATVTPAPQKHTVTLSISCSTILNNLGDLNPAKNGYVPSNGVIYGTRSVEFTPGETVFDVLTRETRNNGIQMEFNFNPLYNSAYIMGIANLYEFDCGSLSGWMYAVNGWYPNYGCSAYSLSDGDVIAWNYTCDLGRDLGAPQG